MSYLRRHESNEKLFEANIKLFWKKKYELKNMKWWGEISMHHMMV